MNITVIVCTYNRYQSVSKALDSVAASALPSCYEWEVLVVDNNSNDQTHDTVANFCQRFPGRFRYLFEPTPGKSYALNAGIREARGDVLAFMDDDVTVEPTWLRNLTAPLHNGEWAGAGGRTLLAEPFSPPPWLALSGPHRMEFVVAPLFDQGNEPCELDTPPFGANMAFQRKVFVKYGLFRTDLGPSPGSELRNEDTEFGRRLMAAGERLRYEPSAVAYHPAPRGRIKKDFFLSWWFDLGRAQIRETPRRPDIWGIPRRHITITKLIGVILVRRTLQWILAINSQRRFYCKCNVWATIGQVLEVHRRWRDLKDTEGQSNTRPGKNRGWDVRIS